MNKKSSTSNAKPQANKKINKRLVIFLAVGCVIIIGITAFLMYYNRNYAAEVAAPIEKELVKAGAVKKCSSGSSGREFGGSNLEPWYGASFVANTSIEEASNLITQAARYNGHNLAHATLEDRGPVMVDDAYINKWYFDTTMQTSPFTDLKDGVVELTVKLDSTKNESLCGESLTEESTIIDLRIKLPEQKWRLY